MSLNKKYPIGTRFITKTVSHGIDIGVVTVVISFNEAKKLYRWQVDDEATIWMKYKEDGEFTSCWFDQDDIDTGFDIYSTTYEEYVAAIKRLDWV